MATTPTEGRTKLLPRNVAALRRLQTEQDATHVTAGNSVTTRLESGVGNCFPGLECDVRNLERRFFPFLEVNIQDNALAVVAVDRSGAQSARVAGLLTATQAASYETIAGSLVVQDGSSNWTVTTMSGDFGPLGPITNLQIASLNIPSSGPGRQPPDCWTAIRLLKEGTDVTLGLIGPGAPLQLTGKRARYLDDNGALAAMFLPGELTQSLCSPWTHDFRDCACFYWASNHPDIVQPLRPPGASTTDPALNNFVDWERSNRAQTTPPPSATREGPGAPQMAHYDINNRWEQLHFVLNGREQVAPLDKEVAGGTPFQTDAELIASLRFAAGVELAVTQEYLCAAFSLIADTGANTPIARAVRATRAELMRIAIGEMRHLRVVNEVLAMLPGSPASFKPALQVSTQIPITGLAGFRARKFRPLNAQALTDFIEVETAAHAIDQLYSNVMATFRQRGLSHLEQVIASIISDGEDHLETFEFMQQWIAPFGAAVLHSGPLNKPPANDARHIALQMKYIDLLNKLFRGYSAGLPAGALDINGARNSMVQTGGIADLAAEVANAGFLVVFDDLTDPRFAPLPPR